MKNALILHGTDFSKTLNQRDNNWFPWHKKELEKRGYEVFLPELPQAWEPDADRYFNFLSKKFDFNNESVLIGHSSGASAILGILDRLPGSIKISSAFLVAGFIKDRNWNCGGLFKPSLNWKDILNKANKFYVIHSDDDPYCPVEDAEFITGKLNAKLLIIKEQKHFSIGSFGKKYKKFPLLLKLIEEK